VRPLRIAIQIERFDPSRGGAEAYAGALARGLAARGQDVTVIAGDARDVPEGVAVRKVALPAAPRALRILSYALGSARAAREGRFDIVHALGKSLGMNILNPHGGVEAVWLRRECRSHPGIVRRAWWTVRRRLSPRHHVTLAIIRRQYADPGVLRCIALSRAMRDAMVRIHGVDPARIAVVPNPIEPARFRPPRDAAEKEGLRARLGLPADRPVFVFAANNFRLKGLEPLVRALAAVAGAGEAGGGPGPAPFRLAVLGRGKPRRYLALARALGIADLVEFRGPVTGIEDWYRAADGLLSPTFYDAYSLAVVEARASGLPVLASRHAGAAETIRDGEDGAVVDEPDDIPALAAKLRPVLDAAWRRKVGEAARAAVLRDPAPDPAEAALAVYRDALGW
jgi:UDP-glucose:(heptosyl)LPS alpha-1,3-glucosyltransferase